MSALIERVRAAALDRGGCCAGSALDGRALVIAVPLVWLLVFFLVPFLVVAKISLSEAAIARPPYLPLSSGTTAAPSSR